MEREKKVQRPSHPMCHKSLFQDRAKAASNLVKLAGNVLLVPAHRFWQSSFWAAGDLGIQQKPAKKVHYPWILFQILLVLERWPHQRLHFHGELWLFDFHSRGKIPHWPFDSFSRNGTTFLCPDLKPASSFQPPKGWAKLIWAIDQIGMSIAAS